MISTKGRYALRLMVDISLNQSAGSVALRDVAERQELSQKYLESISVLLSRAGLLISQRGKQGGYRLSRPASEINIAEVICAAEGGISPVACAEVGAGGCERACTCPTLPVWKKLDKLIEDYLSGITIEDLAKGNLE